MGPRVKAVSGPAWVVQPLHAAWCLGGAPAAWWTVVGFPIFWLFIRVLLLHGSGAGEMTIYTVLWALLNMF